MNAIALPINQGYAGHPVFLWLEQLASKSLFWIVALVKKNPVWVISLLFLSTVGFVYTVLTYIPLTMSRRSMGRLIHSLVSSLDGIDERRGMELHASTQRHIKKISEVASATRHFFIFQPIHKEFKLMLLDQQKLERALFEHLYPEINTPLTKEQEAELVEAFKPWNRD